MRKFSSGRRSTTSTAMYQSPSAITSWKNSLRLPDTPSERLWLILVQSSKKPSSPLAMAVPNTASAFQL